MAELSPFKATIDAWQVRQLRITLFATPDALPLQPQGWWEAVTGVKPERIEDKPRAAQHREEGPFLDGQLTLSVAANRIDWGLETLVDLEEGLENMPGIGPFVPVRDEFTARVLTWIHLAPPCHRLAFGGWLFLPVSGGQEGYRRLAAYLPFAPDPDGSRDLRYQINRPRPSSIQPRLKINRLQVWSISRSRSLVVPAGIPVPLTKVAGGERFEVAGSERFAVSFEPDVNTDADFLEELPKERIAALVRELVDLASELAAEGDRP
jgi:hypothetical protein